MTRRSRGGLTKRHACLVARGIGGGTSDAASVRGGRSFGHAACEQAGEIASPSGEELDEGSMSRRACHMDGDSSPWERRPSRCSRRTRVASLKDLDEPIRSSSGAARESAAWPDGRRSDVTCALDAARRANRQACESTPADERSCAVGRLHDVFTRSSSPSIPSGSDRAPKRATGTRPPLLMSRRSFHVVTA